MSHPAWETGGDVRGKNRVGSDRAVSKQVCLSSDMQPFNSVKICCFTCRDLTFKKTPPKSMTFLRDKPATTGSKFLFRNITLCNSPK